MRDRFKELFEKLKLSQAKFAEDIGMTAQAFSNFMQGRTQSLTLDVLDEIKKKFNVNPLWLLTGEGQMFVAESTILDDKESEEFHLVNVYLHQNRELFKFIQNLKHEPRKNQEKVRNLIGKLLGLSTKDLERLEAYLDGMEK